MRVCWQHGAFRVGVYSSGVGRVESEMSAKAAMSAAAANLHLVRIAAIGPERSERPLPAHRYVDRLLGP